MNIEQLFSQADEIIDAKGGQEKTAATIPAGEDSVIKMANALIAREDSVESVDMQPEVDKGDGYDKSLIQKVAESIAIADALSNFETFRKISILEKSASDRGIPQEEIDKYISKKLAGLKSSLAKSLTLPGALLGATAIAGAGGAGYATGNKKGEKKGYKDALSDVNQAFSQYSGT